jgi:uncharacterized protein (TIGR03435 family)
MLVVGKNGPKFHETALTRDQLDAPLAPAQSRPPFDQRGVWVTGRGQLTVNGSTLGDFADALSRQLGHVVLDKTQLSGNYDFKLQWTPEGGDPTHNPVADLATAAPTPNTAAPDIFRAVQEQLGLKLESQKAPMDALVIDRIERPSEN